MSIKIITGLSSIQKQRFVVGYVSNNSEAASAMNMPVTYLFPQVSIAKRFAHDYISGIRFVDASYSFNRWFEKVWEQYGTPAALITSEQRELVLQEVSLAWASDVKGNVIDSKNYITLPGVQRILIDVVETFGKQLLNSKYQDIVLDQLGPGIYDLVSSYFDRAEKMHFVESADAMKYIAQKGIRLDSTIVFEGFNNFSQAQLDLIVGIGDLNQIILSLNYDNNNLLAQPLSTLISYIQNKNEVEIIQFTPTREGETTGPGVSEWISHLHNNNGENHRTAIEQGVLSIALVAGRNAEIAAIGDEVIKALESFKPGEVVVALRNAKRYAASLQRYLSSHDIQLDFDLVIPLVETYFGASIIELFRTNKILWSILMPESKFELRPSVKTHALFQTMLAGSDINSFWQRDATLRKKVEDASASLSDADRLLKKENQVTISIYSALQLAVSTLDPLKWKLLFDLCLAETLARTDLSDYDIRAVSLAHHELLSIVSSCTREQDNGKKTVNLAYLVQSVMSANLQFTQSQGREHVLLTDAHRMRGLFVPTLILGGLANDDFKSVDKSSLTQDLAERLSSDALEKSVLVTASDRDNLLINDLLASAQNRLVLVGQCAAEDNTQKALTPFLEMITASLDEEIESLDSIESQDDFRAHLNKLKKSGVTIIDALDSHAVKASLTAGGTCAVYGLEELCTQQFELERGETKLDLYDGESFESHEFSPSALETYAHCPYRWFLSRYVPNRPLDVQFTPTETGTLVHKLLEEFYKAWNQGHDLERICGGNLDDAKEVFEKVQAEVVEGHMKEVLKSEDIKIKESLNSAVANAWSRIENDQMLLISEDDVYFPTDFEVKIGSGVVGDENKKPGLDARVGKVKIAGSIDRVDRNSEGKYFIVDYKGGLTNYPHGDNWVEKCSLQAGLYWLAYENATGNTASGSAYISYKTNQRRWLLDNSLISEDLIRIGKEGAHECDTRSILDEIAVIAERSAELMHGGNVKIAQGISVNGFVLEAEKKGCKYCVYKNCPALISKPEKEE